MIHSRLVEELQRVARRYRSLYVWKALALSWSLAALLGLGLLVLAWKASWAPPWTAPLMALLMVALAMAGAALAIRRVGDLRRVARRVEARHPELEHLLSAALEQKPALAGGRFGYLQETVIREALSHAQWNHWPRTVSPRHLRAVQICCVAVFALVLAELGGLVHAHRQTRRAGAAVFGLWEGKPYQVHVTPGDAEIERGTGLVVTARFQGPLPDDAMLWYRKTGTAAVEVPMSRSLSDPMFGARLDSVDSDLTYRVEYAGRGTRDFRVSVFDYPELVRADVRLVFPAYTGLAEKRIEDTRRVTAVEGTRITLDCRLNKPVQSAQLAGNDRRMGLAPREGQPGVYTATWTLETSGRYQLQLVDDRGRRNKQPAEFNIRVVPNRPPDVKVLEPARDMRVSPLEELETKASVWDDFGLRAYGISYSLGGNPPSDLVLGGPEKGNVRKEIVHQVDFEALHAEPDQLLSYHYWAEDIGPDGRPRRVHSDIYFAEVRHFEEIFRQGEQPPGGQSQQGPQQGGNARQAEELAEKQKEIINATWTVIRREVGPKPTPAFAKDAGEIAASQQEALQQARELAEKLQDPESQAHLGAVQQHMAEALGHQAKAAASASPQSLQPALAAEQAAYQALLKLRAREHRVTRGNSRQRQQSSSASNAQSRFQQQLDQLELTHSENRYETERQAKPPQDPADRETREVMSRLRDLARRQGDLNERLKELQSALQEAKTAEQRREIERQLQRLRDQQQQMLRDTDELSDRMQRPENQERMAQSQRDLQNTRQNIRQAADALGQGEVSQAVASGTRAQRELEQLRDQFRRQSSGRFNDEVSQLRQDARRLDRKESALGEKLRSLNDAQPRTKSLRDSTEREALQKDFERQKEDLGKLLDRTRQLVQESEEAEPLLAQQLYDAFRDANQQKLDDALDAAGRLLDRGFVDQAELAESKAGQGIRRLREGVEKAAESVLGDETEALRRARDVLRDLADEVDQEIRRGQASDSAPPRKGDNQPDQPEPGQDRQANAATESQQRPFDKSLRDAEGRQPPSGQRPEGRPTDRRGQQRDSSATAQAGRRQPPLSLRSPNQPQASSPQDIPESLARFPVPQGRPDQPPESGPIAGDGFLRWSDRLRDVEEMIDDADLRAEAARVRDNARGIRRDFRRKNFRGPNWDLVQEMVATPLAELRDRVTEEIARRGPRETLVPIDRDPVPPRYAEDVRRYYELLGSGQ